MSQQRHRTDAHPPGWSYNPSAWSRRVPILVRAAIGFLIALYLSLYQLGVFATVWEPFFGDGSRAILHSAVATLLPVPDATLGATAYLLDVVTGSIGGTGRWRTKPWIVILFGFVVIPVGTTGVTLVILQGDVFHHWCTLCLTSALISVSLVGPVLGEVLASLQHLKRSRARGESLWNAFWGRPRGPAAGPSTVRDAA